MKIIITGENIMDLSIKTEINGSELKVLPTGSINTQTAPDFENSITTNYSGIDNIIIDLQNVDYVSSAGLRVLLRTQNHADDNNGTLTIKNANDSIKEVFDQTGFSSILDIQ
jgi:anti-sigma B factor antagonist